MASLSRCAACIFGDPRRPHEVVKGGGLGGSTTWFRSAVFMWHLRSAGRWRKLLGDEATEQLHRPPAAHFGKRFPKRVRDYPLERRRCRRKKAPGWLGGMVVLLEPRYDGLGTSWRAAEEQRDILRGT